MATDDLSGALLSERERAIFHAGYNLGRATLLRELADVHKTYVDNLTTQANSHASLVNAEALRPPKPVQIALSATSAVKRFFRR